MGSVTGNSAIPTRVKRVLLVSFLFFIVIIYPSYVYYELQSSLQSKGVEVKQLLQSKINHMFDEMGLVLTLPELECDKHTVQALRRASFYSPYLTELGLFNSEYRVYCTDYGKSDFPIFRSIRSRIEAADDHRSMSIALSKSIKERALFAFLYDEKRQIGINGLAPPHVLENGIDGLLGDEFGYRIAVGLEVLGQHDLLKGSTLIRPYESYIRSPDIFISVVVKDRHIVTTLLYRLPIALLVAILLYWSICTGFKVRVAKQASFDNRVRKAITNRDIDVYFQPIIDIKTSQVSSAEALIRWQSERFGNVEPTRIVSVAAKYDLMNDLTTMIIRSVGAAYRNHKGVLDNISIFVNVDLATLCNDAFIDDLRDLFSLYPELEGRLGLETHGLYLLSELEYQTTVQLINTIRQFGIAISLDDFGLGYADTSVLKSTSIDVLKLDRRFVSHFNRYDVANGDIVKQALVLANEKGIELVAEGVETSNQMERLTSLGIRYIQGYHYNRALPEREFVKVAFKNTKEANSSNTPNADTE
ncbi:EAL domain-containing protein [Marinomonas mediterranea]|jgi:FOG: EAL domain|uniref:cyclic-guanylate-specific phosphodiesterase n=1 Tax=Marinomonas mediterranea (strain ATCC 700492 / JCM 21426 / NBRC 103028 / MMB-1) TaxID=717774 RepID=F2JZJ5_MARM1|nr:EAL domain-containing protein [Marinomonas mediterranea]ADZ89778.1 diguanylate phosphodiesterase [Marinomonas mediterranea MMB-1]WCN16001.1 EAL domain-containing protein [Marinomonas mediterranea MMB-1]